MNRHWFCILLFPVFSLPCSSQQQNNQSAETEIRQKIADLHLRIEKRDYTAFLDAVELNGISSVSFLWCYAHGGDPDPQTRPKALEAMKQIRGFKEYFQTEMTSITDRERDPWNEVQILTAIGNREAAEVIAPYLFDYRFPSAGDYVDGPIYNRLAAQALGKMHFADAPIPDASGGYAPEKLIAWQRWAIDHEMVPKEWASRVGIPEWQYKLAALELRLTNGKPEKDEQERTDPSDAKRVWPPNSQASAVDLGQNGGGVGSTATTAMIAKTKPIARAWALWAGIVTVLAATGIWLLLRWRGSSRGL